MDVAQGHLQMDEGAPAPAERRNTVQTNNLHRSVGADLAAPEKRRPSVLIVDGEALMRWSLGERLRAEGYDVLQAGTGGDALDQLPQGVDLVVLDLNLPDADGLWVLRQIKGFDPRIAVLIISACSTCDTAVDAARLGALGVTSKPFGLDHIVAIIDHALGVPAAP
jgi:DNA-binding NtrC family response regulator